jgi:aminoglycoside 6'-N-acetyltransferase I
MTVEKFPGGGKPRTSKSEPGKSGAGKPETGKPAGHGHVGVREATRFDYDALRSLFERFYREQDLSDAAIERIEHSLRDVLHREDTAAFVALIGDEVVGGAAMSTSYGLETGLCAELQDVYVEPEARGRGAGGALVEAGLMWAERMGCWEVSLVLTPAARADRHLLDWFAKRGFADAGRVAWRRELRKHD